VPVDVNAAERLRQALPASQAAQVDADRARGLGNRRRELAHPILAEISRICLVVPD
jgi:hypothetical protein